jgi:hypothetical protein
LVCAEVAVINKGNLSTFQPGLLFRIFFHGKGQIEEPFRDKNRRCEEDELPNENEKIQDSGGQLGGVRTRNLKFRVGCEAGSIGKKTCNKLNYVVAK